MYAAGSRSRQCLQRPLALRPCSQVERPMHMVHNVSTFAPQVRTLPSVLKFLPSQQARDGGQYINSLQYWLGGNAENLENLVLSTAQSYVPALKGVDFNVSDPELFPEVGIWHPLAPGESTVLYCWAAVQAAKGFLGVLSSTRQSRCASPVLRAAAWPFSGAVHAAMVHLTPLAPAGHQMLPVL